MMTKIMLLEKPYWQDSEYETVTPKIGKGKDRTSHLNHIYEDDFGDILYHQGYYELYCKELGMRECLACCF